MARAGRKRKKAQREPNGRIKRASDRDVGTPELARRIHAMKGKGTPALMTDQLCAMGLITDEQNQAAALYRWFREKAYGKPSPAIAGYGEMIGEGTLRPIAVIDPESDPQARAEEAYRRGHKLILHHGRIGASVELTRVVIDNDKPVARDFKAFQEALSMLHQLYFAGENEGARQPARRTA